MTLDNPSGASSMAEWAAKNNKKAEPVTPVTPPAEPPVVPQEPAAQVEPPKEPETPPSTNVLEVPEVTKSWDEDVVPEPVVAPTFDFKQLGSALELGEIKDADEFIGKVKEIRTKAIELETNQLAGIPDEFKEVLKVAKTGERDWKEYLSTTIVDFSKIDPVTLYEDEFSRGARNNPKFFTDGKFDQNKLDEALDAIPDAVKDSLGRVTQQSLMAEQSRKRQEILTRNAQRLEQAESSLVKASQTLGEILPVDSYGIKFEQKHSSHIQNGIRNSSLTKKHLGVSFDDLVARGADMKAVTRTIGLAEYGEKMLKFKSENSKAVAKKEILASVQNAQITNPGSAPKPEDPAQKKLTYQEKMAQHMAQVNKSVLG